jgi:Cys-Gly metallodipeptidase DUG1
MSTTPTLDVRANCRLVPPQTPDNVDPLVIAHLEKAFAKLESKNKLTVESLHGGKPWVADHRHWNFEAAKKATKVCPVSLSDL